ncbi:MAG: Sirohydrochlorin cobaltochelatase [Firmicutes bacterium]|nr:Sirohydrochlorin cobaltochelatase [Bacillota bacterium]MDI6705586.1 sirohydrochlorin cobaltochelatase [Bacillota bacterium]
MTVDKKAVLVVSFGTSYHDALKSSIESAERDIYEALPDYEPRRAFTSEFIVHKLAKRDGILVDSPVEALARLKDEGFTRVVVQPLHIIPGFEYHEVQNAVIDCEKSRAFQSICLGEPLLYNHDDYSMVVKALEVQLTPNGPGEAVVFMGHGTNHISNASYYRLQRCLDEAGLNAYIANVEGDPSFEAVRNRLHMSGVQRVCLMPFMLVAGDHAKNDMAGGDDSWKGVLEREGFRVDVHMHGLGENEAIRRIYVQKAIKAVNGETAGKGR